MVSNDGPSAPRRRICHSRSSATSASVAPSPSRWPHRGQRGVGDGARRLDAGHLARVLDAAQGLDQAPVATSSASGNQSAAKRALLGPGDVLGLEAQPAHAGGRGRQVLALARLRAADDPCASTPAAASWSAAWSR